MRWTATQGWRKTRWWCIESRLRRCGAALALNAPVPFQDPATRQPGVYEPRLRAYPQVPTCPHCVQ